MRGLKPFTAQGNGSVRRRTLTGAWIETSTFTSPSHDAQSRTLTGAWIETFLTAKEKANPSVAPSRVRGLKQDSLSTISQLEESHPHGGVD